MNPSTYKLGLVSVSFRNHTPEEIISAAKDAGLTCIEWGSDVHCPPEKADEIAALQARHGITCCSYGTYFRLGETPISQLQTYIDAAKKLGTDILRLWCGSKSGRNMTESQQTALVAECRMAAEIARQNDVILCMECHRNTFTENPDDAVWLMDAVNSPCFRMYWQPFQWQRREENIANAIKIAPYAEHIHVFNWQEDEKFPLAQANDDWRRYLSCFDVPRTLLLEFMPNDTLAELPREAESLQKIVGGLYESNLPL